MTLITKLKTMLLLLLGCCWNYTFCQNADYAPNQLLIKLKPNRTASQKAQLKNRMGATALKTFTNLGVEIWNVPPSGSSIKELVQSYREHPDVVFVEPNYYVFADNFIPDDPGFNAQWGVNNTGQNNGRPDADIDAPEGWGMSSTTSLVVAVIDSGIDWRHEDLIDNIWQNLAEDADNDGRVLELIDGVWVFDPDDVNGVDDDGNGYADDFIGWDFVNDDNNPYDDNSHGTHVAGTIGARGNNGIGVTGVCHEVKLVGLKTLNANGRGIAADGAAALKYALNMGIPISNNSWGGGQWSQALSDALMESADSNHLFIAAAGNNGRNIDYQPHLPAAYPFENIITVGALTRNDRLRSTSNYGKEEVDISAPGKDILSCLRNNSYGLKSGTSMAAPHVAGVCALLWDAYPGSSALQIKEAVLNSSDPVPGLENISVSGGRVNLYKALQYFEGGNCREPDSLILATLYHATEGDFWNNSWNLAAPVDTWFGVEVNALGCVTSLDLAGNNLRGTLPEELANLEYLGSIDFSNNKLTFDDLEALPGLPIFSLGYAPQDSIHIQVLGIELSVQAGGVQADNTYEWYNGNTLVETNFGNNVFTPAVAGWYHCKIKNSTITNPAIPAQNLVLTSKAVYVDPALSGRARDSLILVDLYHATNGTGWTNSWVLEMPMDNWFGVSLNAAGRVTCLDLDGNASCSINESFNGNNLTGTLPLTLGNLTFLEKLFLQNNNISGELSENLGNLTNLTRLQLNDNNFTYKIPASFGNLTNLSWLYLENNSLRGAIPESLGNLVSLTGLFLQNNSLSGSIPANLGNMTSLQFLYLNNNILSGAIPGRLGNMTALKWLYCNFNNLTGRIPDELGNLPNIRTMKLNDNLLNGTIPETLGNLSSLQSLSLANNNLAGTIPATLANLSNLNTLEIQNNRFTFAGMELLPPLGISNLDYAPQDSITTFTISSSIYVEAGGVISNNQYTWYKNNVQETTIPGDSIYTPATEGWYRCVVTNSEVPNLSLQSRSVYYVPEPVWPGDFNNDGIANNDDLLYWGLAADLTGPARLNATTNWTAQDADNWPYNIYNVNGKHQDGNGDGTVNATDIQSLNTNYGRTHNYAPLALSASDDKYEIVALFSEIAGHLRYGVRFDNPDGNAPEIHGFSCTVYLGSLGASDAYIVDAANSCISPDESISRYDATENKLDIAVTRTDKINVPCDSLVVEFIVITENIVGGEPLLLSLSRGTTITAGGDASTLDNTSYTSSYSETAPDEGFILLSARVDHEECDALGEAEVVIEGGVRPYTVSWSNGSTSLIPEEPGTTVYTNTITNLIAGLYAVTVTDAEGLTDTLTLAVEGPLLGCDTDCPSVVTLVNNIPANTYQANALLQSSAIIETGKSVIFKAGQTILLEAGFEVQAGGAFDATIEGCY